MVNETYFFIFSCPEKQLNLGKTVRLSQELQEQTFLSVNLTKIECAVLKKRQFFGTVSGVILGRFCRSVTGYK